MDPTYLASLLLTALLASVPRVPQPQRGRIAAHREEIVAHAAAAYADYGVDPAVFLTVGFLETHLGQDNGEGGGFGAPIDIRHRHTAGTPAHAARALARSYRICRYDLRAAVGRWRSGLCRPWQPAHRRYVATVMRLAARSYARAGLQVPAALAPTAALATRR